jgi:hypothetical protein
MMERLISFLELVFTPYFVGLLIVCGIFLSYIYPVVIADNRFPIEYKIGKYAGYLYIGGSLIMYIITMLLG